MTLNPNAKKILCFGDSLTWGHFHSRIRFVPKDRWTYKLQNILGDSFEVIEEGLCSRTTNIDDVDALDRNGFTYFRACFESHDPVDVLVYMLGTNDTKVKFKRDTDSILAGITETIDWMISFNTQRKSETKIILVAPPQINVQYLKASSSFDKTSNEKLIELSRKLESFSKQRGYMFLNLATNMIGDQNDGVHLAVTDNQKIAENLSLLIGG